MTTHRTRRPPRTITPAQIVTHLEYLGYEVDAPDADGWRVARHQHRWHFQFNAQPPGILLYCAIPIGALSSTSRAAWLDALNSAGEHSGVARMALCRNESGAYSFKMRARLGGAYGRDVFATLMDAWHHDQDLVRWSVPPALVQSNVAELERLAAFTANATLH